MIELKNIRLRREKFLLRVDKLEIKEGQKIFLVGASGAGKTTLLEILAGLEENFEGEYRLDNISKEKLPPLNQRGIMFLSQEFGLWEHLSVIEHIAFVLNKGESLETTKEAKEFLEIVGLLDKKDSKITQLSTGQRQRLALARALSAKPKYLFLDEPFSNVDIVLAYELIDIINKRKEIDKFALIQSTHHPFGFKDRGSRIIILSDGEIIQQGEWSEIQKNPKNKWIKRWVELVS